MGPLPGIVKEVKGRRERENRRDVSSDGRGERLAPLWD
jgi:hypothetical protein